MRLVIVYIASVCFETWGRRIWYIYVQFSSSVNVLRVDFDFEWKKRGKKIKHPFLIRSIIGHNDVSQVTITINTVVYFSDKWMYLRENDISLFDDEKRKEMKKKNDEWRWLSFKITALLIIRGDEWLL